ncbi:hypothetical protein HZA73_07805 [candidate division TA06 bacterium]|nr:hypothetical protein [candidate division TA06 bacterium]
MSLKNIIPKNVVPNVWDKTLVIANIVLVVVTAAYMLLTGCMVDEMKRQNTMQRQAYLTSLCPYLFYDADSINVTKTKIEGKEIITFFSACHLNNEGNTPAEIVLKSESLYKYGMDSLNLRDTILINFSKIEEAKESFFPNYIAPHKSFHYYIQKKINNNDYSIDKNGITFLHILIIYRDNFNSYHDIYFISKISLTNKVQYMPTTDLHDYTESEIKYILKRLH